MEISSQANPSESSKEREDSASPSQDDDQENDPLIADDVNWVDGEEPEVKPEPNKFKKESLSKDTLAMVETAFFASTSSLIWLIDYYFPLGPVLRIFFPLPIALVYLRWGHRSSIMAAGVSSLLISVLMGPVRSMVFLMPYGFMGVQLGFLWRKSSNWLFSIGMGTIIGSIGLFFRFWLFSLLLGQDLWLYIVTQMTVFVEWGFSKLGLLAQPSLLLVQGIAIGAIVLNNLIYLFVVHSVALLVLDRLGNPIPRPPKWVSILFDYE